MEITHKKKIDLNTLILNHDNDFTGSEEVCELKARIMEIRRESFKSISQKELEKHDAAIDLVILAPLFIRYFKNRRSYTKFDETRFAALYEDMENFVYGNLSYHYYAPMPKFKMNGRKLELHDGLMIRKITHKELLRITGVNLVPVITTFNVTFPFNDLHYMLEYSSGSEKDDRVYDLFQTVINVLRVFQEGEVGISTVFKDISWFIVNQSSVPDEWKIHFYDGEYVLDRKEAAKFKRFYRNLHWVINERKGASSLRTAISRFNSALEEAKSEDQIIDFMIALEAMYSSDNKELSYRISYRIANLLAEKDYERRLMFLLLRQTYERRSALVHGAEFKPIKIRRNLLGRKYGKQKDLVYDAENIAQELEKITRKSIKKFLKLLIRYDSREEILSDLDLCVLSDNFRQKLKQMADSEIRLPTSIPALKKPKTLH